METFGRYLSMLVTVSAAVVAVWAALITISNINIASRSEPAATTPTPSLYEECLAFAQRENFSPVLCDKTRGQ